MKFNIDYKKQEVIEERNEDKTGKKCDPGFFLDYVKHVIYKGQIIALTDVLGDDLAYSLYTGIIVNGTLDDNEVILALEELVRDFELIVNKKMEDDKDV